MRVFLSYPREILQTAEHVRLALAGEGHHVFFDRTNLPPGEGFNAVIREEILGSDLFVYLVTPDSVAPGCYARTELKFAEQKWPHPRGRVLSVMAQATAMDTLPPYASAATVLDPSGNLPAEVAAEVNRLAGSQRKRRLTRLAAAIGVVAVAGLAVAVFQGREPVSVDVTGIAAHARGFVDQPDRFRVTGTIENDGKNTLTLHDMRGEVDRADVFVELEQRAGAGTAYLESVPPGTSPWTAIASFVDERTGSGLRAEDLDNLNWRTCIDVGERNACSAWSRWSGGSQFDHAAPMDLTAAAEHARDVAYYDGRFLLVASQPNRLLVLSVDGDVEETVFLQAEPVSVAAGGGRIIVASMMPDSVTVLDFESLGIQASQRIPGVQYIYDQYAEPASTRPVSLALANGTLWLATSGGSGEPALLSSSDWGDTWNESIFLDGDAFDQGYVAIDDLRLRARGQDVWGVTTGTVPSSIYRISAEGVREFGGHDHDDVSCATDVAPTGPSTVILRDCKSELIELKQQNTTLEKTRNVGRVNFRVGAGMSGQVWEDDLLAFDGQHALAAVSYGSIGDEVALQAGMAVLDNDGTATILFDTANTAVKAVAAAENRALLIVEQGDRTLPIMYRYPRSE